MTLSPESLQRPDVRIALAARAALILRQRRREVSRPTPQPGPQTRFLQCTADIAIYGGSAGSAKSFGLLMWPMQYVDNPGMRCVIFRRLTPELTNPGALWDESKSVYRNYSSRAVGNVLEHHFPSGAYVKFAHLEKEDTVHSWDSSQIPLIGFDQLEQFSMKQFFYMHSRNRSMSGVPAQIRGACNPDADSWLAGFISWWIDQSTGLPIWERSGVVRYFHREGDSIMWADTAEELIKTHGNPDLPPDHESQPIPTSCTFIPGTIFDNPIMLRENPKYLARLKSLPMVERERLLGGNWKIRPSAGLLFQRAWCPTIKVLPAGCSFVRGWDLAGTEKTDNNEPDWTVGIKLAKTPAGRYVLCHGVRARVSPAKVKDMVKNIAQNDGATVRIHIKQDPGQAGKAQIADFATWLDGFIVHSSTVSGDKATNFGPFSAQAEHGNVDILEGFNEEVLTQLEAFPDAAHDDDADAVSTAYQGYNLPNMGLYEYMREQVRQMDEAKAQAKQAAGEPAAVKGDGGMSAIMEAQS